MDLLFLGILSVIAVTSSIPTPTAPQLAFSESEIAALIHFNMATFTAKGGGCNSHTWNHGDPSPSVPSTFNPTHLNVSNWIVSMKALGVKHSVLTAKHGCGFLLWPTKTTFSNGKPYGYNVGASGTYSRNVLKEYSTAMEQAGIGHGFYYSTGSNFYLNDCNSKPCESTTLPGQHPVSQSEYHQLVISHLTELWSEFGNLTEIWFDGGYGTQFKAPVVKLLQKYQPNSVAFNGYGVSPNPIRWIGTESGLPAYPVWSTGTSGTGDPNSSEWVPAECDTTLQDYDKWFYDPDVAPRSLPVLIDVYHHTVGQNGLLEIDFAIDRTGNVHPSHAKQYKALGDWIRSCYGKPLAVTSGKGNMLSLKLGSTETFDRIMIQEHQQYGQRIRNYTVESSLDGKTWETVATGSSVGNKRIQLFTVTKGAELRLKATGIAQPDIRTFAVFAPCAASA